MTAYPESLFERYRDLIPDFDQFQQALLRPQPNQVRVNTLRTSPEVFAERMKERYGVAFRPGPFGPASLEMDGLPNPGATVEYFLGHYHMQGFSSMIPPLVLAPRPGDLLLDLCASPGSKTTQLAAMIGNDGLVVANDARRGRINLLKFQIERLGVLCSLVTNYQAQAFPLHSMPSGVASSSDGGESPVNRERLLFDRILADVPCTGEGSFRIAPLNRKNRDTLDPSRFEDERAIARHGKIQHQILRHAWSLLRPGGALVYSTCTFAPEENEEVVDDLLSCTDAQLEPIDLPGPWEPGITVWQGKAYHPDLYRALRVYPHRFDSWGFFVAKISKPLGAGPETYPEGNP